MIRRVNVYSLNPIWDVNALNFGFQAVGTLMKGAASVL